MPILTLDTFVAPPEPVVANDLPPGQSLRPLVTYHCDTDLVETWITLGVMRDKDGRSIAHNAAAHVHACKLPVDRR